MLESLKSALNEWPSDTSRETLSPSPELEAIVTALIAKTESILPRTSQRSEPLFPLLKKRARPGLAERVTDLP
mgnify:CR=1 FL=1